MKNTFFTTNKLVTLFYTVLGYFVLVVCWFLNHSWLLGNTMYCCKDCCLLGNRRRPVKQLIGVRGSNSFCARQTARRLAWRPWPLFVHNWFRALGRPRFLLCPSPACFSKILYYRMSGDHFYGWTSVAWCRHTIFRYIWTIYKFIWQWHCWGLLDSLTKLSN